MATIDDVIEQGPGGLDALLQDLQTADLETVRPLLIAMLAGWLGTMMKIDLPERIADEMRTQITEVRAQARQRRQERLDAERGVGDAVDVPQPTRLRRTPTRPTPVAVAPVPLHDQTPTLLPEGSPPAT